MRTPRVIPLRGRRMAVSTAVVLLAATVASTAGVRSAGADPVPVPTVQVSYERGDGIGVQNWLGSVHIAIDDPATGANLDFETDITSSGPMTQVPFDIKVGDVVTATGSDQNSTPVTKELVVPTFTVDGATAHHQTDDPTNVPAVDDLIFGTAPPGTNVFVHLGMGQPIAGVTAGADGRWQVDATDSGVTLEPPWPFWFDMGGGAAWTTDEDGDGVSSGWSITRLQYQTWALGGIGWRTYAPVTVDVYDPNALVRTVQANVDWPTIQALYQTWNTSGVPGALDGVQPGWRFVATQTDPGYITPGNPTGIVSRKTFVVPAFSIGAVDTATKTVSGMAPTGTEVRALAGTSKWTTQSAIVSTTADLTNHWSAVVPFDYVPNAWQVLAAPAPDPDGDGMSVNFQPMGPQVQITEANPMQLNDGQTVHVHGTGWPVGEAISIGETNDNLSAVQHLGDTTVMEDGTFFAIVTVHRTFVLNGTTYRAVKLGASTSNYQYPDPNFRWATINIGWAPTLQVTNADVSQLHDGQSIHVVGGDWPAGEPITVAEFHLTGQLNPPSLALGQTTAGPDGTWELDVTVEDSFVWNGQPTVPNALGASTSNYQFGDPRFRYALLNVAFVAPVAPIVTVDPTAVLDPRTGSVLVTVMVSADTDRTGLNDATVRATLTQPLSARAVATGSAGPTTIPTRNRDQVPFAWKTTFTSTGRTPFRYGTATLTVTVESPGTLIPTTFTMTVTLMAPPTVTVSAPKTATIDPATGEVPITVAFWTDRPTLADVTISAVLTEKPSRGKTVLQSTVGPEYLALATNGVWIGTSANPTRWTGVFEAVGPPRFVAGTATLTVTVTVTGLAPVTKVLTVTLS